MQEKIKAIVKRYEQDMIDFRRELHMNPEISMEEVRTTKRISEELTKAGIEHRTLSPSGVIAEIKGGKPGKTVALRGDMDALTMDEYVDVPYKSQIPGRMHGCGHDSHTAMLLTAAKALNEVKDELKGNVRFFFQPGEEVALGAKLLIENGCMEGVDNVCGLHVNPDMPTFKAAIKPGPCYASCDIIQIRFKGVGSHGAQPQSGVDAIVMASNFVMNIQTAVSRLVPPLEPAVVTIGKFDAGTRFNIIAQDAVLDATARVFSIEARDTVEGAIRRYAQHIAEMYKGSVEIDYNYATLPLINEEQSALLCQKVVTDNFGPEHLTPVEMTMGAEDFCFYMENCKGCFISLGTGNPEKQTEYVPHSSNFNIDEDAMCFGAQLLGLYAYSYLEQDKF